MLGVSDGPLLSKKVLRELIQPFDVRVAAAAAFLRDELQRLGIEDRVRVTPVAIDSPTPGRGCSDPSLDCLVVSEDSVRGGEMLNEARRRNGVEPMRVGESVREEGRDEGREG